MYSSVFTNGAKKTGYLVFNTFLGTTAASNELITVFNSFISQGVNELIIDLRNNLGGSTAMQDFLANIIVPAARTGQTMYRYEFNQQLQQDNFPLLKKKFGWSNGAFKPANNTETFVKNGTLALSRIFFIVTDNTASSSELLINNLKRLWMLSSLEKATLMVSLLDFSPLIYLTRCLCTLFPLEL
ncbi:S41 family peptidase [Niabella hibiscisoli]|uniref:S41 family peptidase n=1 Tax=Niabella hibiscisoli TaxID=1825928 RepID=UPI001F0E1A01|nr:S41 family peptidase [Niabella hibiscisoli]MCH5721127.1 S41 family peptidase [Niabella hibiscisoli]